jgi:hypothetical protein
MKGIGARFGGLDLFVKHVAVLIKVFDDDPLVQNGRPFTHIQECIGLLPGNDFVKFMAIGHLFCVVVLPANFDDQLVSPACF